MTESKQTVTPKKKKSHFFETYISKVLKQVAPDHGITSNAKQQLNSAICCLANKIANTATHLTKVSKKKTLSEKEVSNAVKIIFPGELATNSVSEGEQSILKFTVKENEEENKNMSRQDKAGILFPPSVTEKFLRNFGFSKCMITKNAPVFLAATLEYLTQDILQLSADMARENNRVRITIRDLELSVRTDPELTVLFGRCNLNFIGGGVVPSIHSSLLLKKRRKKKPENNPNRNHRFRPGTVAIREIKKFQKISDCLIFAKFPFERYVRSIIAKFSSNEESTKISKELFIILQYFIEQYTVELLRDANEAAIHCKRVKLMPDDIKFICKLRGCGDIFSNEPDNEPRISSDPILEIEFHNDLGDNDLGDNDLGDNDDLENEFKSEI